MDIGVQIIITMVKWALWLFEHQCPFSILKKKTKKNFYYGTEINQTGFSKSQNRTILEYLILEKMNKIYVVHIVGTHFIKFSSYTLCLYLPVYLFPRQGSLIKFFIQGSLLKSDIKWDIKEY
ncbi:unnamed protein product [Rhizophagus irregularis]|nr:unnamed protein product [Rhizophagus irregularis]